ncbi:hypothetical protein JCM16307_23360 [Thermococcus prieurii]
MYISKYDGTTSENKEALEKYQIRILYLDNLLHPNVKKEDLKIIVGSKKQTKVVVLAKYAATATKSQIKPLQNTQARYLDTKTGKTYQTLAQALNSITPADLKKAQKDNPQVKTKLDYITHYLRPITKLEEADLDLPDLNFHNLKMLTVFDDISV